MSHQIFGFAGALRFKIYLPPSKDNYLGMLNFLNKYPIAALTTKNTQR